MKVFTAVRPLLHLFAYYPLLLLVVTGLLTLVCGGFLAEYDAFHQVWHESPITGVTNGLLVAFILGLVTMSVRLADDHAAKKSGGHTLPDWSYRVSWGLLLIVAASPMAWKRTIPLDGVPDFPAWRWWFPAGLAAMAAVYFVGLRLFPKTLRSTPRAGAGVLAGLGVGYAGMLAVHTFIPDAYCPYFTASVSFLLLLAFVTAGVGAVTYLTLNRSRWLYPALLAVVVLPFLFPQNQIENRLPNMTDAATGRSYYDTPARLAAYPLPPASVPAELPDTDSLVQWNERMKDEFGSPQPLVIVTCSGGASASAIYTADVLFTLETYCPGFSKRIRLVTGASGGMLGAAYFVSQLRDGGRIAAAHASAEYRAYLELLRRRVSPTDPKFVDAETTYRGVMAGIRDDFFKGLEADFLGPLVQKWVHKDIPLSPFGLLSRVDARFGQTANDRGAALERAWAAHQSTDANPALDVPFRALQAEEMAGTLPSLVFTPMMVEDGRQLIVSNLDLGYMVETGKRPDVTAGKPDAFSYMAVEFAKLFPNAADFKLSTAVRMNASFPLFSPAAALPTDPVRHVVDAGYYDNYGTAAAAKWLLHEPNHRFLAGKYADEKDLAGKEPEVMLLRIRCFADQHTGSTIPTTPELERYAGRDLTGTELEPTAEAWAKAPDGRPAVRTEGGLFTVTAPLSGLFAAWRANMVYRADERLASVLREYKKEVPNRTGKPLRVRVTEYPLVCLTEPSLNWVLTRRDIAAIHHDVARDLVSRFELANFYNGRGSNPDPTVAVAPTLQPAPMTKGPDPKRTEQTAKFVQDAEEKRAELGKGPRADALTPAQNRSLAAQTDLVSRLSQLPLAKPTAPTTAPPTKK